MSDGYGEVAVKAVRLFGELKQKSPRAAWDRAAAEKFGEGTESFKKGCPRNAFLGHCEAGIVKGIPAAFGGSYTRSKKNKKYVLDAVEQLSNDPELADEPDG